MSRRGGPSTDRSSGSTKSGAIRSNDIRRQLEARIDYYRRREKELLALHDFTFALNRARGSTELLRAIVNRARSFIGSDICYLSSFDSQRKDFFASFVEGGVSREFARVRIPQDLGSCKPIIETKIPFVTENYRQDVRFVHDTRVDAALQAEGIVSMAGVPLLLEDAVLGILYVADRRSRTYQPEEIALLVSLTSHAALAMENARLFEESQNALLALKQTTDEVQSAIDVHEQLTELVAKGGGLDELANRMSTVLSAEIMILDLDYAPVAHAVWEGAKSRMLGRLVRKRAGTELISALAQSRWTGRSVSIARNETTNVRGVTIVGASQLLGAVLVSRSKPMTDSEIRTFERGAMVTGIVLLSLDRFERSRDQELSHLLMALRERRPEAAGSLAVHAKRAGISIESPLSLVVVETGTRALVMDPTRALRGLPMLAAAIDGHTAVLCETSSVDETSQRMQNVFAQGGDARPSIAVAPVEALKAYWGAYELAVRCLRLVEALGRRGAIVQAASLSVFAALFADHTATQLVAYVEAAIGPLLLHDKAKAAKVADTMRLYLDLGSNTSLAAKALNIHENTVRQRLETAKRLLGADCLSKRAFETQAALKLHFLMGELRPGNGSSL
jgi:DNA-binding PucR family transcriptional regulator